jgi:hypothetical protein
LEDFPAVQLFAPDRIMAANSSRETAPWPPVSTASNRSGKRAAFLRPLAHRYHRIMPFEHATRRFARIFFATILLAAILLATIFLAGTLLAATLLAAGA